MFCFKFKIYALSCIILSLFMEIGVSCSNAPSPFFFSVKLETYSAATRLMTDHGSDANNFVCCSSVLVSYTQRNIVLPCKLRIPESKLLVLFKPLRITFFHENSHFVVFQSFKTSCSKQRLWPSLLRRGSLSFFKGGQWRASKSNKYIEGLVKRMMSVRRSWPVLAAILL